jgi:hypothetical protein
MKTSTQAAFRFHMFYQPGDLVNATDAKDLNKSTLLPRKYYSEPLASWPDASSGSL